jgi:hypothetical protein
MNVAGAGGMTLLQSVLGATCVVQALRASAGSSSGVSAAPAAVVTWAQLAAAAMATAPGAGAGVLPRAEHVVVCSRDGSVDVLALRPGGDAATHATLATGGVQLPAELFSGPVAVGPYVLLGCRDDCLYCLRLNTCDV